MEKWLRLSKEALLRAETACTDGEIPRENMFMLAPIFYAEINKTQNHSLLQRIGKEAEDMVYEDWRHHPKSKEQYKFHFVSSFLYGYVVADKITELKYDDIMQYVNDRMDLFNSDYDE